MSEASPLVIVKSVNVVFPQWGDVLVTIYVGPAKESVSAIADVTPEVVADMADLTKFSDGAAVFDHGSRAIVAWVPTLDLESPASVSVLVHELIHVAVFALQRQHIDLGPPDSAQELLAYTVEYIVRLVLQAFAEDQTWYEHRFIAGVLESRGVHYKDKKTRRAARKPGATGEGVARHRQARLRKTLAGKKVSEK